jgi:hypothetical protein
LQLIVDDLVTASDADLQARPLAPFQQLVLWFLRDVRRPERFVTGLHAWDSLVRALEAVDDSLLLTALQYLREFAGPGPFEVFRRRIIDLAPSQENLMISAAQFDFDRGREKRHREGHLEKGIEKGLRGTLATLLAQRFGPLDDETQAWIARAAAPRLERALARLLTAPTVTAVLDE